MNSDTPTTTADLSGRELECLNHVADGLSAKEIALRCGITPRTVEAHLDRARLKLNARNRAHMVALAIAQGVVGKTTAR
ncbi:MAG: helix-turn-helix domain-containing protein [Oceanicaulis sp.]